MQMKTKSAILLGTAFILGIVVGSLINSWIVDNKIENMRKELLSGNLFMAEIERTVELSDTQKVKVDSVLQQYRPKVAKILFEAKSGFFNLVDSLSTDLKQVLTDDQYEELKDGLLEDRPFLRKQLLNQGHQ